jgi:5-methylcytosine-specific restriction endonuclease McrA
MSPPQRIELAIRSRAGERCEYCRMAQSLQGASFHFEHIIPRSRGGSDGEDNLAFACPGCNLRKSNRTEAVDPETSELVPLFHPLRDAWEAHFAWNDLVVRGLTAIGRATVAVLDLNHPRRLMIRRVETAFGLFPPD